MGGLSPICHPFRVISNDGLKCLYGAYMSFAVEMERMGKGLL